MSHDSWKRTGIFFLSIIFLAVSCTACASKLPESEPETSSVPDTSHFLVAVEDEPDTVDFQCTSIHYTIAQNVFNRRVEMENDENGEM